MGKIVRGALALTMCLVVVLGAAGCFVPIQYEKSSLRIPPEGLLRLTLDVEPGEVVRGSWQSDEPIEGSYTGPVGTKLSWTLSPSEHTFVIDGEEKPGSYVFVFRDAGGKGGTVTFRYSVRNKSGFQPE